ncbi:MAG: transposase [Firmicutes bacterium]|nr:transposase [Bacillota bacterium]
MEDPTKNLEQSWQRKADEAHDRVMKAIRELKAHGMPINFNTVHIESGASKSYLYKTPEIRETIEAERSSAAARAGAWHKKYDRTSRSKDVVIEAKDKRIAKLEEENRQLRRELDNLRRLLYEKK